MTRIIAPAYSMATAARLRVFGNRVATMLQCEIPTAWRSKARGRSTTGDVVPRRERDCPRTVPQRLGRPIGKLRQIQPDARNQLRTIAPSSDRVTPLWYGK